MIENWNKIQELTDVSLNSMGTSVEKYNNYLQSIESKSAVLQTSVKQLWNNLLPADFVGNMTDAGTSIVQFTDKYQILQTMLKGATFYALAKGIILAKDGFTGMVTSIRNVSAAMNLATQSGAMTSQRMSDLRNMTKVLTDSQLKLILSNSNLSEAQMITMLRTDGVSEAQQKVDDIKLDMVVSNLEKQKEALEEQKNIEVDKFDNMITALNEQKDTQEKYFETLIEILENYSNPKATENIKSVWDRIFADNKCISLTCARCGRGDCWVLTLKPCKRIYPRKNDNTKKAVKQGNAEERPDADCWILR